MTAVDVNGRFSNREGRLRTRLEVIREGVVRSNEKKGLMLVELKLKIFLQDRYLVNVNLVWVQALA